MAVAAEARCDLRIDCTDKSDEQNCEICRLELCSDGRCVSQPWLSDGEKDCVSLYGISDPDRDISINGELDCAFLCNRSECVGWGKLGDGVLGCHGPEGPLDETLGALEPVDCEEVWAPKCVYQKIRLGKLAPSSLLRKFCLPGGLRQLSKRLLHICPLSLQQSYRFPDGRG